MNQFPKIAAVVAALAVMFLAGAVIGGAVMMQVARVRFQYFENVRQAEQRQDERDRAKSETDMQQFRQMIGALRQRVQQSEQQLQQRLQQQRAPEQFGPQLMRRFLNQIRPVPTQEQRDKMQPLINQAAEDLRRLRRDTTHNTEMILDHLQDQITAVLTPEQRNRFSDMVQRSRDAFQRFNLEQQQRQAQQRLMDQQQMQRRQQQQRQAPAPQASPPQSSQEPASPPNPAPAGGI